MWTGLNPGAYVLEEVDAADGYNIIQSVLKGQADGAALFDLDGLALRVQNKASGGAGCPD